MEARANDGNCGSLTASYHTNLWVRPQAGHSHVVQVEGIDRWFASTESGLQCLLRSSVRHEGRLMGGYYPAGPVHGDEAMVAAAAPTRTERVRFLPSLPALVCIW